MNAPAAQNAGLPELSVIIPVYNEKNTIGKIVDLVRAVPVDKEIIIVDDGSTDGTRDFVRDEYAGKAGFTALFHEQNRGKGKAIRTGILHARGRAIIIQDADLEYDPKDYPKLLDPFRQGRAAVVYGSRFLEGKKVTSGWHRFVNYCLTSFTNILYGSKLTDMETCYKLFSAETLKGLRLESSGFEIEVELTAKILKSGEKILETPISYKGRSFHEGKKIGWLDGFKALAALARYRFTGP